MAALSAIGCSRGVIDVAPLGCITRKSRLSLNLSQHWKQRLGNSSSACRVTNVGRRWRLGTYAGIKVGDAAIGPAHKVKNVEPEGCSGFYEKSFLTFAIALMPLVEVEAASAAGGEFGLLEGRTLALIHPLVMGGLLAYTVYAGYLGWQWRRVRTIQTEISELKKQATQVPVAAGDKSAPPSPPSPVQVQLNSLTEERKELVKGGFKDRHFNAGSVLLGLGVFESVGGAVNTWFRTGKLFPGPHLFAGAGITICWALAASLVPAMQKGNETARNLHIGLNLINVVLFIWQIPTGWEIVLKVFEFTTWP